MLEEVLTGDWLAVMLRRGADLTWCPANPASYLLRYLLRYVLKY